MFTQFLQRIISHGVDDMMEQAHVSRIKRINFLYLVFSVIKMGIWDSLVFFTTFVLLIFVSLFVERSNRILVTTLMDSTKSTRRSSC